VSFATLEAAVAHAHAFASPRSLHVWVTRDGVAYARHRGDSDPVPPTDERRRVNVQTSERD